MQKIKNKLGEAQFKEFTELLKNTDQAGLAIFMENNNLNIKEIGQEAKSEINEEAGSVIVKELG